MSFELLMAVLTPVVIILIALFVVGMIFSRFYKRATPEVALVRTGSGGRKVVIDGGVIVVPFLHEIAPVNMRTLRIPVQRSGDSSLITLDKMRVDVEIMFYVRVSSSEEAVREAAQTLGNRTFDPEALRDMIEGKLVDALRAVAASMNMNDLHERRADFVQSVQKTVHEDLKSNGLMLESASLTGLDQTPFDRLDENNAFNAVGMRELAEIISASKSRRAEVQAETETKVRQTQLEAAKRKLQIDREEEEVRISTQIEIAKKREESQRETEAARIARERAVEAEEIARQQAKRTAEIEAEKAVKIADQLREIEIAEKSEAESLAKAKADEARAKAKAAEAAIETAEKTAQAEREKRIAILAAEKEAETQATRIRLAAKAEREAAEDRAAALREAAEADAFKIRSTAEAKKEAALAEAEGRRALVEAENLVSPEVLELRKMEARLDALPRVMAEAVRPAEKIDSIRIHHVSGLGGFGSGAKGETHVPTGTGSLIDQAIAAVATSAVAMPALKRLGAEIGVSFEDGVAGFMNGALEEPHLTAKPNTARHANGAIVQDTSIETEQAHAAE